MVINKDDYFSYADNRYYHGSRYEKYGELETSTIGSTKSSNFLPVWAKGTIKFDFPKRISLDENTIAFSLPTYKSVLNATYYSRYNKLYDSLCGKLRYPTRIDDLISPHKGLLLQQLSNVNEEGEFESYREWYQICMLFCFFQDQETILVSTAKEFVSNKRYKTIMRKLIPPLMDQGVIVMHLPNSFFWEKIFNYKVQIPSFSSMEEIKEYKKNLFNLIDFHNIGEYLHQINPKEYYVKS